MTGFKPGDHVQVTFDGWITRGATGLRLEDNQCLVGPEWAPADTYFKLPVSTCTLIRPPLKVGDVLTADDPEPPKGTIVLSTNGHAVERYRKGWCFASSTIAVSWASLSDPVTVLYVPDADQ